MNSDNSKKSSDEPVLREHVFDGIEEYDQKLPNWWLFTLWITVVFFVVYWLAFYQFDIIKTNQERLDPKIAEIRQKQTDAMLAMLDDDNLWKMSRDSTAVAAGKEIYTQTCLPCHGPNLGGQKEGPQYVGLPLNDDEWKYGGKPTYVYQIVFNGSPDPSKGMVAWGPLLGAEKAAKVTAYVLSKHDTMPTAEPVEDPAKGPLPAEAVEEATAETPAKPADPKPAGEVDVKKLMTVGETTFMSLCVACHGPDGKGMPNNIAPGLAGSEFVNGPTERLAMIMLNGIQPEGRYTGVMVGWKDLMTDEQIAGVLTYIRNQFGNKADPVFPAHITAAREKYGDVATPHPRAELEDVTSDLPPK